MTPSQTRFGTAANVNEMGRPMTGADIMDELDAEIHRQYKRSPGLRGFTKVLGVDYHTYRRYIVKERQMPTDVLADSLRALNVSPEEFFKRLRQRIESEG